MPAVLREPLNYASVGLDQYQTQADTPAPALIEPARVELADAAVMSAVGIVRDPQDVYRHVHSTRLLPPLPGKLDTSN